MPEAERVAKSVTRDLTHHPAVTLLSLSGPLWDTRSLAVRAAYEAGSPSESLVRAPTYRSARGEVSVGLFMRSAHFVRCSAPMRSTALTRRRFASSERWVGTAELFVHGDPGAKAGDHLRGGLRNRVLVMPLP